MRLMNWTPTHFPAPMRSLSPSTRAKAIEIANALMARENMDRQEAIQLSIIEARRQAKAQLAPEVSMLSSTFSLQQA
ncbi:hypothetical protein FAES_3005 [Fibrella aestuarina BUZ 2]|uniref:Uncharacterized protein n=1 Tax=Fibrella aestuarina BUZ 2 TaxID=1166018 RepID=I0KA61_9BACT|nr:hypothetical protein [Fibrella aestuarina]CCH01014.1 hypothetical protein FAES_3005 [Fibrella aestuarina BUZ 2]